MFKEKSDVATLAPDPKSQQQTMEDRFPIPENLFVDNEPPSAEQESHKGQGEGVDIQQYLDQDFFNAGYKDGFDYHSQDTLTQHVKVIKSEFRMKIDLLIDLKKRNILELKNQDIEVDTMSERISRQINLLISDLTSTIESLEKEKELSSVEEGWIMKAIHAYRDGFFRGLEMYNNERLLGFSTGTFN
jgi:hypothetical protein